MWKYKTKLQMKSIFENVRCKLQNKFIVNLNLILEFCNRKNISLLKMQDAGLLVAAVKT